MIDLGLDAIKYETRHMRALHCLSHVVCVMKMSLQGKLNITSIMRRLAPRLAARSLANHFIVQSQSDLGLSQLIIRTAGRAL